MSPEERAAHDACLAVQDAREGRTPGAPSPLPWRFERARGELRGRIVDAAGGTVVPGVRPADAPLLLAGADMPLVICAVAAALRARRDAARAAGNTLDGDAWADAYAAVLCLRGDEVRAVWKGVVGDGNG